MSLFRHFRSGTKCILCTLLLLHVFLIGVLWNYGQTSEVHANSFPRIIFFHKSVIQSLPTAPTPDPEDYVLVSDSSGFNVSCYKEGLTDSALEELTTYLGQCSCKPEWHGPNCALPEVVWRAFMKSKMAIKLEPNQRTKRILYLIKGHFSNSNLFEVQVNELASLVDYFIFCQEGNYSFPKTAAATAAVKKSLTFYIQNTTCSPDLAVRRFRKKMDLEDDDIFLQSNDGEILSSKAIRFFKNFYVEEMGLVRFRLKYNVFGFFWQHLKETIVSGALTTIVNFEAKRKQKEMIIGDLNYFGGWFCEYCSQPEDIVHEIHVRGHVNNKLLRFNKNGRVDENYVQYLITNGLYVDGTTKLIKLHRSDVLNHYGPSYALDNSWKFHDLLVNVFLSFNNEADYEEAELF